MAPCLYDIWDSLLCLNKLRAQDYQPLIDKVRSRICSWTTRPLSFAGRLQSVIFSIINFWSASFPLPKKCFDLLQKKVCNSFLWNGAPDTARGAEVSWDSVCTPGGLGLRRLEDMNQVFSLKLIWMLFASNGSLWEGCSGVPLCRSLGVGYGRIYSNSSVRLIPEALLCFGMVTGRS